MRVKRENATEALKECLTLGNDHKQSYDCPLGGESGSLGGIGGAPSHAVGSVTKSPQKSWGSLGTSPLEGSRSRPVADVGSHPTKHEIWSQAPKYPCPLRTWTPCSLLLSLRRELTKLN